MWKIIVLLLTYVTGISSRYYPHEEPLSFGPLSSEQVSGDRRGYANTDERNVKYWYEQGAAVVRERLRVRTHEGVARNVIMFLGDGMSPTTVTAARIYVGQLAKKPGEEQELTFEKLPYTGLSKTYCVDAQVADSGCSGTAYLRGVKSNLHTVGVTADVEFHDWQGMLDPRYHTTSIAQWAQEAGKDTGVVTTARVTDASPAAAYANSASRYWETDQDVKRWAPGSTGVQDISRQLVENNPGNNFKVILGGGRQNFLPKEQQDGFGHSGARGDGKDLIQEWRVAKDLMNVNASYITTRDQLLGVDVDKTDYLLGLFQPENMDYHLLANSTLQPTLAEMTSLAIKMMQKEKNGYFLFIEGGRIDHAHHEIRAHLALDEVAEFDKAIEVALAMTSEEDTLIVVTADHASTMTMAGYPERGSDIFTTLQATEDGLTYPTLSYANGRNLNSFEKNGSRHNIANDDRGDPTYKFPATFNLRQETHGGEDVAVYARGPWAHLLVGVYEQSVIAHVMSYAARIGPGANITDTSTASGLGVDVYFLLLLIIGTISRFY